MKTLIELYDEVPIENVLAADTFLPERIIYLCPDEIAKDKEKQKKLREYFPPTYTTTQMRDIIEDLLADWKRTRNEFMEEG